MKTRLDREAPLQDGHEDVNRHRNPYLSFDGILTRSVKRLDSEVLLDRLEKQLSGKGLARCSDARPVSSPSP